ncbi:MAG: hypothetical protein MUC79_02895 [Thiobacillaceae bacterium]|jgi:hypothetical protein|nr:hypothetical protein [Thiobacillaceae bacterium]
MMLNLLKVRSGYAPVFPEVASVINSRTIDDNDVHANNLFSFLMFMFALTETGEAQAPVVTVPAR